MKDYEKKYKEALERAKKYRLKEDLIITQDIFPELKESEDERIRKEIINYFRCQSRDEPSRKDTHNRWIAWLEKQDEQKTVDEIAKEVCKDKTSAVAFLKSAGIMNEKGELAEQYRQDEQKPVEWSEEDKRCLMSAIAACEQAADEYEHSQKYIDAINWLQSIKDRILPQPKQEWSEEDEKKRELLIAILNVNHPNDYFKVNPIGTRDMEAMSKDELVSWLKSLRPQNTWKPSEEQLKILNEVLSFAANHESPYWNDYIFGTLSYLIRQLKKLTK